MLNNKSSFRFIVINLLLFISVVYNLYQMNIIDYNRIQTSQVTIESDDIQTTLQSIDYKIKSIENQKLQTVIKNIDKFLSVDITKLSNDKKYIWELNVAKLALHRFRMWDSVYDFNQVIWKYIVLTDLIYPLIMILCIFIVFVVYASLKYRNNKKKLYGGKT